MQAEAVRYFAKLIEKELGIIYSEFNQFQLQNRLEEIAKTMQMKNVDELFVTAQRGLSTQLRDLLFDTATNNETSFFRDTKLFEGVRSALVPQLVAAKKGEPIRIWSAACSTGQEPLSLAMCLQDHADQTGQRVDFNIVATDISSRVLERARQATFSQLEVDRGLTTPMLAKYFDRDAGGRYKAKPLLTDKMRFQRVNLLDAFTQLGMFDLIFCRNVLIYQDVASKMRIIEKLRARLAPNAYFVMGAGESMIGLSEDFDSVKIGDAIVYRQKAPSRG